MKIAHLTTADISLRYLLLPQLTAVARIGWTAIGISAPGEDVPELESRGIRHIALKHSTRSRDFREDLSVIPELWGVLRRLRPDVLHTHNPKPGVYGRVVGRLAGVPVVLNTVHGLYASPDDSTLKKAVVYTLEAVASRFSDYELVQSSEDYELLTRWHITRPGRTILLRNGVDIRRFDPDRFDESDRASIRRELDLPPDMFVTGIVARLVQGKGFAELTDAAEQLDDRHVIIAAGPDDPDKSDALSPEQIARARAAGIRFLGHRDDVDRLYAAMDAFVLPSHREGFPRAAMEAAAMSLPVVASNIRGCRQVVDDGVTGILFPLGSAEGIASALVRLADDPPLRDAMGAAARTKAVAEFDERSVVDTVLRTQVIALREKGRFDRLETKTTVFSVRWATKRDLPVLAAISVSADGPARTVRLAGILTRRRRHALARRIGDVAVVEDGYGPVGFAVLPDPAEPRTLRPGRLRERLRFGMRRRHPSDPAARKYRRNDEDAPIVVIAPPFRHLDLSEYLHSWVHDPANTPTW